MIVIVIQWITSVHKKSPFKLNFLGIQPGRKVTQKARSILGRECAKI